MSRFLTPLKNDSGNLHSRQQARPLWIGKPTLANSEPNDGSRPEGDVPAYGPLYSNWPTSDDCPECSKLMFGSVSFRTLERLTPTEPV